MKLYHFTALEYLEAILDEGLTRGDVPLSPKKAMNAVWLTSNPEPEAQGWASEARELTEEERELHERVFGRRVPAGSRWANKRAVVLEIEIPDDDRNLVRWVSFARRRGVKPAWLRGLNRAGGGGHADWFLYRGCVPRDWIVSVGAISEEARSLFSQHGWPAEED